MHPAYSVIFFTTASGAGYGLLIWLALLGAMAAVPITLWIGLVGFALAFGLISFGLMSSALHLGRPERAWRAFTQWRSSWLSREGVLASVTYMPAGLLALLWVFTLEINSVGQILAAVTIIMALITVFCTGMIYASLPTIRQWHNPMVTPIYLALALATGAVWADSLLTIFESRPSWLPFVTAACLVFGAIMKLIYWRNIDTEKRTYTIESATGLGRIGKVRPLEPAHTQPNFVMREMGYKIGRSHAEKLRKLALVLTFIVPAILVLLPLNAYPFQVVVALLAIGSTMMGVFVERWLFFAEAEHVVMLYYGESSA